MPNNNIFLFSALTEVQNSLQQFAQQPNFPEQMQNDEVENLPGVIEFDSATYRVVENATVINAITLTLVRLSPILNKR